MRVTIWKIVLSKIFSRGYANWIGLGCEAERVTLRDARNTKDATLLEGNPANTPPEKVRTIQVQYGYGTSTLGIAKIKQNARPDPGSTV